MPITVNYNPDIELLGQVSYETGVGAGDIREQQRRDMLRAAAQERMDRLRSADIARYDQYNQADMQRQQRAEELAQRERENEAAREQQQQQFEMEQGRLGQAQEQSYRIDSQRLYSDQIGRMDEAKLRQSTRDYYLETIEQKRKAEEAQQEQWRQEQAIKFGGEWKLDDATKQQKDAEMAQLQQYRQNLAPEEYSQFVQQLEQKYQGLEKLVPQQKTFEQEVQESSWPDTRTGFEGAIWYKNPADGSIRFEMAKPDKSKDVEFEKRKWLAEQLIKIEPTDLEEPEAYQARLAAQKQMLEQTIGLNEPAQPPGQASTGSAYGFALEEQSPVDTDSILQQLPPESQAQIADYVVRIKEADASGDMGNAQALREELKNLLAQLGLPQ